MEVNWNTLSSQPNGVLSDQFVQKFNSSINFNLLVQHYFFSSILINLFFQKINFKFLLKNQKIDESLLRNYSLCFDSVTWGVLPHYQNLSQQFLKDYKDQLKVKIKPLQCYDILNVNNTLTFEKLDIEHFQGVCYEKTKSNKFAKVDLHTYNWTFYIKNVNLTEIQLRKLTKYFKAIEWAILPKYYNLSTSFKQDFKYHLYQYDGFLNKTCYPNFASKLIFNIYLTTIMQFLILNKM